MMPTDTDMDEMMGGGQGPMRARQGRGSVDQENEEKSSNSAIVPLSLLGSGVKEGDTVSLKVGRVYGNEAEVMPADESEGPEECGAMSADQELDSMDSQGG